ncbi:hypothetical protein [Paracoccus sp. (in: a-proteobacteria)]|uniref:hypothetical protein n=1 Tax=Paracoccus sp. TaxID=267 RepID=UPI0035AE85BA
MTAVDQPPDEGLAGTIPLVFLQGCKWCPETVSLTVMVLVLYPLQAPWQLFNLAKQWLLTT